MAYFDFNPFGYQALIVKFNCDECGKQVISEEIGIPEPNYAADTASGSQTDNEVSASPKFGHLKLELDKPAQAGVSDKMINFKWKK